MVEARDPSSGAGLTYLMVGGGPGAFIGAVHKTAIDLLAQARMVGGCFSRTPEKSKAQGKIWNIDPDRVYDSYQTMIEREAARPDKPDFIVIVTPNNTHYPVAKLALQNGFHVACDKPLCHTIAEAEELVKLSKEKNLEFLVTYTYLGYPLVRQMREMVKRGDLGEIRVVVGEYAQGWLADNAEDGDNKQASWRTDPAQSGIVGAIGDIGTHAESLVRFTTGLEMTSLLADLDAFVPNRKLDDNGFVLFKAKNGAKGTIWASQVAIGCENKLSIRIYGTKAALEWHQENPNTLMFSPKDKPVELLTRANGYLHPHAARYTHLPTGHPEGLFEAFANLYDGFIQTIIAKREGRQPSDYDIFPTVEDGLHGVKFIHSVVDSSKQKNIWVDLD